MIELKTYEILTFDCYGTLVDWGNGILGALNEVLRAHHVEVPDTDILSLYAELEAQAEGGKFVPYRKIQEQVVAGFGERLGFLPSERELACLSETIGKWSPFPDTIDALRTLRGTYELGIISNVDDDMFLETQQVLGVDFKEVITAQQVGSYKPSHNNFNVALERIGLSRDKVLHVAQSLYHDIIPAKELGFSTVWVNRKRSAPNAAGSTNLPTEVDMVVPDLNKLVSLLGLKQ